MDRERRASGHTHPDHIGGNTDANGHAVFARARCVLWRGEWDWWTNEANLARLAAVFGDWSAVTPRHCANGWSCNEEKGCALAIQRRQDSGVPCGASAPFRRQRPARHPGSRRLFGDFRGRLGSVHPTPRHLNRTTVSHRRSDTSDWLQRTEQLDDDTRGSGQRALIAADVRLGNDSHQLVALDDQNAI
jgi:hypothetical protein